MPTKTLITFGPRSQSTLTFRNLDLLSSFLKVIADQAPLASEMIQGSVIISTDDFYFILRATQDLDRLNSFSILNQARIWGMIREEHSVQNKMTIIWFISKVPTITIVFYAVSCLRSKALVKSVRLIGRRKLYSRD